MLSEWKMLTVLTSDARRAMSKFTRSFNDKARGRAWIEKCKKAIPGCTYGTVYAIGRGGHYHAYISGEFTEEEALAQCPKNILFHKYE